MGHTRAYGVQGQSENTNLPPIWGPLGGMNPYWLQPAIYRIVDLIILYYLFRWMTKGQREKKRVKRQMGRDKSDQCMLVYLNW